MQNTSRNIVVLGTGGTIAGTAGEASDNVGYTAAQIGVGELVRAVPALAGTALECEQVAQLDSKDMGYVVWRALALRVQHHLRRDDVAGVVVTHGTDTLEETAYFLQRVLAPAKPVVMTAAMRPATSLQADGPQNLLDAVHLARHPGARGVVVVVAGQVHGAAGLRKAHTYRLEAFGSGDAGPMGVMEEHRFTQWRPWPEGRALGVQWLPAEDEAWPRVEIVTSHVGADGLLVRAMCESGVQGLVVAATGNGTVHRALETALVEAQDQGVTVWRSSRCGNGRVLERADDVLPSAGELTPAQARVELILQLLSPA